MRIINIITGIINSGYTNTTGQAKIFLSPIFSVWSVIFRVITPYFFVPRIFIILRAVTINSTFVNIIAILQRQIIADIFIISLTAERQFLPATFFVITGNFVGVTVIVCIFVGNVVQSNCCACFFTVDPRFCIRELIVLIIRTAEFPANINFITGTTEIFITD